MGYRARVAAVLLVAFVVGCTTPPVRRPAPVREIQVTGSEFRFEPNALELQTGQPVRLLFRNAGTVAHDLQILDMPAEVRGKNQQHSEHGKTGANGAIHLGTDGPGQSASIEFVPTKAGDYTVICTMPGHTEGGMKGTVRVR